MSYGRKKTLNVRDTGLQSWPWTEDVFEAEDFDDNAAEDYDTLRAERDALRKAVDGYAYIGRDGKVTLAKDLESERDQLRTQLHTAHNAGLDAAIKCINEFLSSERIGSHEYVKGQTECMLHLLDKISAMKSGNGAQS